MASLRGSKDHPSKSGGPPHPAFTEGRPGGTAMAWSPDGRSIVFSSVQGDRQQLSAERNRPPAPKARLEQPC